MHVTEFTRLLQHTKTEKRKSKLRACYRMDFIKQSLEVHFGFAGESFVTWWGQVGLLGSARCSREFGSRIKLYKPPYVPLNQTKINYQMCTLAQEVKNKFPLSEARRSMQNKKLNRLDLLAYLGGIQVFREKGVPSFESFALRLSISWYDFCVTRQGFEISSFNTMQYSSG